MEIRILGCHGSLMPGRHTTSFLLNGRFLVDAGTVASVLSIEDQKKLEWALITHAHLDHVKDILFLADNLCTGERDPFTVMAPQGIIDLLHANLFNNVIWPDFSVIPTMENPVIRFRALEPGWGYTVSGLYVRAIPVNHTVETMAYLIEENDCSVLISGDTGPTDEMWEAARKAKNLKAVFIETSFPDEMEKTAALAGHLTPAMVKRELRKLGPLKPEIYLYHLKPQFCDPLKRQIASMDTGKSIHILRDGDAFRF
ncbi:MAG TPA: 3',5'-cyclic-nucleotide phosphodiesterase [Syntrophales bacterium]|nr:3',5'-cyclic-nucleotide phosphodiesterase [Syntrophales bacterium]HQN77491.1 3',5'-cyclic-nucleotide phosphodiesterase [Syntrophales bacterium]HQQ27554.1 3',5'-cyclic-nucleotide phosphodiesterase [Syntrophales bacterium]